MDRTNPLAALTTRQHDEICALGSLRAVEQGAFILRQGEPGSSFFVLLEGRVSVTSSGEEVAQLAPGAVFGEMALFNHFVRVGSVQALSDCRFTEIDSKDFWPRVLHQDEAAVKTMELLGQVMTERLQLHDAELTRRVAKSDEPLVNDIDTFRVMKRQVMADWALKYHAIGRPGKLAITATKPSGTAADLSVAYSPGVAEPCIAIAKDKQRAYDYTTKGQLIGVITNGTAVLGLGDIGPLAAKPVMEGKAVLFKRFADLDAFDIEVDERDPERLIDIVCSLAPTFGGINLEDIKSPECFRIESECQRRLDIPVFHDDQHGTAIIAGAGLMNALELVDKSIADVRVVFSGAGAAGFASAKYFLSQGVRPENLLMTDIDGVVYAGRGDGNYLDELAVETDRRSLAEALVGADVFMGASAPGVVQPAMLEAMARDPIVFAMANPTPEIDYPLAVQTRRDLIMGTGRSDYPNQINNVSAFPYIFRGALDVRARGINAAMKHAASRAIADLARQPITAEAGFEDSALTFDRGYIIPKPFDRRLLIEVTGAVAKAAMETGMARKPIDLEQYSQELRRLSSR
jgi:malate dehydrogenase (oxaloacetate-decarboxylating)(NADP+)